MPEIKKYYTQDVYTYIRKHLYHILLWTGMITGVIVANIYIKYTGKNIFADNDFLSVYENMDIASKTLWEYILSSRMKLWVFMLVMALLLHGKWIFGIVAVGIGMLTGVMVSAITVAYDCFGSFVFLAGIFPQCFFYIASIAVLYVFMNKKSQNKMSLWMLVISFLLMIAGVYAEGYINPVILKSIYGALY